MKQYFETKIKYIPENEEKTKTDIYLVEALSFTETETNVTQYLIDADIKDFSIEAIKKDAYNELVYRLADEDNEWYEAKVSVKIDGDKANMYSFLIAGDSVKDATEQVIAHVRDSKGTPTVKEIKYKKLEDLVIKKECDVMGTIIIGFYEQKELEQGIDNRLDKVNLGVLKDIAGDIEIILDKKK